MRNEAEEEKELNQQTNKNECIKISDIYNEQPTVLIQDDENLIKEGLQNDTRNTINETKITNVTEVSENQNANIRAAFIHIVGDIVQSIGVVIAAVILMIKPEWKIVDPICTFVFAAIVSTTTFSVIKDCLQVLTEGSPEDLDLDKLKLAMEKAKGVFKVHDLHVWTLTEGKVCMSAVVESTELHNEGV